MIDCTNRLAESEKLLDETIRMIDSDLPTISKEELFKWMESFYSRREHNEFIASVRRTSESEAETEQLLSHQRRVNAQIDKMEARFKELELLAANAQQHFEQGVRVQVIHNLLVSECDVKIGMEGESAVLNQSPWPCPPHGKTAVRFDATLFDFIRDEDDEDTWWIILYIPNYALEEIS